MINIAQLKSKLTFSNLFSVHRGQHDVQIHPSKVARMFNTLPVKSAVTTFLELSDKSQLLLFNFLGSYLQQNMIAAMPKEKAALLLNQLDSKDRYSFYISLNHLQLSIFQELLHEKIREETLDMLGNPDSKNDRLESTSFCKIDEDMTMAQAIEVLRLYGEHSNASNMIYVTDESGKAIDDVPIRRLVLNEPGKTIHDIIDWSLIKFNI